LEFTVAMELIALVILFAVILYASLVGVLMMLWMVY